MFFTVNQNEITRKSTLAAIKADQQVCPFCGSKVVLSQGQYCPNCGGELDNELMQEPQSPKKIFIISNSKYKPSKQTLFGIFVSIVLLGSLIYVANNKDNETEKIQSIPVKPPVMQDHSPAVPGIKTPEQIFKQVSPSIVVVDIFNIKREPIGLGSGIVIGLGKVITNCHVAQKGNGLQIRQKNKTYNATLIFVIPKQDLCELSVPDLQAPPVVLGTAKDLQIGQRVYAIGAPEGLELTLSEGIISSLRSNEDTHFIQTSAPISPGSSGGGLFDEQGRLIGITTFQATEGQNLNFALPVDWIANLPDLTSESSKGVKSEPKDADAWNNLGVSYDKLKQYDQAIQAYREALRIQPDNASALRNMGIAYGHLGRYEQSIQALRESVHIQPEDAVAWRNLGIAYHNIKQHDQSIQAFREAVRVQPQDVEAWDYLGDAYRYLKHYDQAIQAYQEVVRIQPDDAKTWSKLGNAYYHQDQQDKVKEIYQTLLKLDPRMAARYFDKYVLP